MTQKPRGTSPETSGPGPGASSAGQGQAGERVVIRDRRKIDPSGGKGRTARPADPAAAVQADPDPVQADPGPVQTDPAAAVQADPGPAQADPGSAGADAATEPAGASADPAPTGAGGAAEAGEVEDGQDVALSDPTSGAVGGETRAPAVEPATLEDLPPTPAAPAGTEEAMSVDEPAAPVDEAPAPLDAELEALRAELDERTRDLQRVSAEYANYRKRVDRDRGVVAEQTTGSVIAALLPVLDDLDRAREHGDLVGPFGSVAEQLTGALGKFGLTAFGEKGDPFDPNRHEAVAHLTSAEVTEPTCVDVMRRGYLLGERLLRAALVAVADPE